MLVIDFEPQSTASEPEAVNSARGRLRKTAQSANSFGEFGHKVNRGRLCGSFAGRLARRAFGAGIEFGKEEKFDARTSEDYFR